MLLWIVRLLKLADGAPRVPARSGTAQATDATDNQFHDAPNSTPPGEAPPREAWYRRAS